MLHFYSKFQGEELISRISACISEIVKRRAKLNIADHAGMFVLEVASRFGLFDQVCRKINFFPLNKYEINFRFRNFDVLGKFWLNFRWICYLKQAQTEIIALSMVGALCIGLLLVDTQNASKLCLRLELCQTKLPKIQRMQTLM